MKATVTRTPANEWQQNWGPLLAAVSGVMLSTVHGYSLGVMIGPLEKEYGWTRAEISSGPMILAVIALVVASLVGVTVDRVGPRRIALGGVAVFCTALAALSLATPSIVSWWLLWVVLSVSAMFIAPMVWTAAVSSLFFRNRGFALAITLCGTGLGAAIVPSLTNALVEGYGWRGAYVGLGIIFAAIVLPLVFFLFSSATDRHRALNLGGRATPAATLPGMSAREGFRSARFLKLAGASLMVALATCAVTANAVPILMSDGFDSTTAAGIAGLVGIGAIIGRLGGGYLLDRLDAKKVAACSVLMPIVTAMVLLAMPGSLFWATAALLFLGLALGTELDACAYLATRHLGLRNFGTLFGFINGLLVFGNGLAPLLANYAYDVTHSYSLVLWSMVPSCLISALLFLLLGPYPAFDEEQAEAVAAH